jgi:hypothetical protein
VQRTRCMAAEIFQVSLKKVMNCNSEWEGKYGRDLATLAVGQPSADGGRFLPTARQQLRSPTYCVRFASSPIKSEHTDMNRKVPSQSTVCAT